MRNDTKRTRGRPRSFDPDVALKAAGERFRAGGFAATSLDDLADATGLNRPSLYAAFGDKRALYLAAIERLHARAEAGFDALAEADLPLDAMLGRLFAAIIAGYLTGERGPAGCMVVTTAATESVADPEIRAAAARFLAMEDERIAALLRRAGSPAPDAHARIVASVVHSLAIRARAGAPREALERLAAECIALIVGRA